MGQKTDIYILGTGITGVKHITNQSDYILRSVKHVFYVDLAVGVKEYLEENCAAVTDLYPITYQEGVNRMHAYHDMAAHVVASALKNPPVAFALYGHPLVYASPPFIIKNLSELFALNVEILPGISSLDTILVDLMIDPATNGIQMYEASDVLFRDRPLQNDVPCLLWQIGSVETGIFSRASHKPGRFERIKQHLLRYYPEAHECTAVTSATHTLMKEKKVNFEIGKIEMVADELHQGATVFIPPVEERSIRNPDLVSKFQDTEHLEQITQTQTS